MKVVIQYLLYRGPSSRQSCIYLASTNTDKQVMVKQVSFLFLPHLLSGPGWQADYTLPQTPEWATQLKAGIHPAPKNYISTKPQYTDIIESLNFIPKAKDEKEMAEMFLYLQNMLSESCVTGKRILEKGPNS